MRRAMPTAWAASAATKRLSWSLTMRRRNTRAAMPATTQRKAFTLGGWRFTHPTAALICRLDDDPLIFDPSRDSSLDRFVVTEIVRSEDEGGRKLSAFWGKILEKLLNALQSGWGLYIYSYLLHAGSGRIKNLGYRSVTVGWLVRKPFVRG